MNKFNKWDDFLKFSGPYNEKLLMIKDSKLGLTNMFTLRPL